MLPPAYLKPSLSSGLATFLKYPMMGKTKLFYGAVINPISLDHYDALPNCLISVGPSGNIEWMINDVATGHLASISAEKGICDRDIIAIPDGDFLMPGFIDTHTHAVQFPTLGMGGQEQLLDWLKDTVFPGESKFGDIDYACSVFPSVIRRTLDCGTTTACYYSSLHLDATKVLAKTALEHGQRAFVGKCNMDDPRSCPAYYIETDWETSLADTKNVIDYIRALPGNIPPLVHPILSPRFALSCTEKLLHELGNYAETHPSLHIQTHYAENTEEVMAVKDRFNVKYYIDIYAKARLLRHNTILGHGVYIEAEELECIRKHGAGIAHCPSSNLFLRSGLAPIGHYLDYGIKVGLATDVSGGSTPSMLANIQEASKISKVLAVLNPPKAPKEKERKYANQLLPLSTLLYLATLGGADLCDMKDTLGSFAPGKSFDALLVSTRTPESGPSLWIPDVGVGKHALCEVFERFLFCGDDRNVSKVWVQGRFVGGRLWKRSSSDETTSL